MALQSSKVAAGQKVLAEHHNKMWDDITANHDHYSGRGGTVDHADLANKGAKTHADIDTHIKGSGSITDNPGGNKGVHGLAASAFAAGNLGSGQLVFFVGHRTGPIGSGTTFYFSANGLSPAEVEFGSAPLVFVQPTGSRTGGIYGTSVHTIGTTSFMVDCFDGGLWAGCSFLAIGTKT